MVAYDVFTFFGLGFLVTSSFAYPPDVARLPKLVGLVTLGLMVLPKLVPWAAGRGWVGSAWIKPPDQELLVPGEAGSVTEGVEGVLSPSEARCRLLSVAASMVIFLLAVYAAGILPGTVIFLFVAFTFFRVPGRRQLFAVAGTALFLYLLFERFLHLPLVGGAWWK